jgi:6-pyruvoyltetrahydropterin/6-carboxytetrahydropterin synthase
MIIEKKYYFYAGHRNKEAGVKCERLHGHTYDVIIKINFTSIKNGITMLFQEIDEKIEPIIKSFDHYLLLYEKDSLCELLEFANEPFIKLPFQTSAENMAIWIYNRIKNETKLDIIEIQLRETKSSNIIYSEISNK